MIDISQFKGEIPRLSDKLLPDNHASSAINCDLQEGRLKPTKAAATETVIENDTETIYRLGEQWLQWSNKINVVSSLVYNSNSRVIYTGDNYPKETNIALGIGGTTPYPTASRRLGISAPTVAPTYAITTAGTGDARDIAYCYTRVGIWEDGTTVESAPSPSTDVFEVNTVGTDVKIDDFVDAADDGVYTTHYYIYRINTGSTGAEYQFVDAILKTAIPLEYDDTEDDEDLGEVLPTENWTVPIEDLKGILAAGNGLLYGFDDNTVYVSETFISYTFPSVYTIPVESEIVGLGYNGAAVIVLTKTRPYMIFGTDPETLSIEQTPYDLPCASARSIISIPGGVIYSSITGLVLVDTSGSADTLTKDIYTKEQWLALVPSSIVAFYYNDAYVAFFAGTERGIEFKPGETGIRILEADSLIHGGTYVSTVSINTYNFLTSDAENFITDDDYQLVITGSPYSITYDTLYLIQQDAQTRNIVAWESGDNQDYTWISKEFSYTEHHVYTAGLIIGDYTDGDVIMTLTIDDKTAFVKTVSNEEIFKIANPKRGTKYKLKLVGQATIDRVVLGETVDEVLNV
jgi:hypothetical protein